MAKDYSSMPEAKWVKFSHKLLHSTGIDRRAEVMAGFHHTLESIGLKHWLAMSALLGIYREGDLIARDEDVDFYCFREDLTKKIDCLKAMLLLAGFDVRGYRNKGRLMAFLDGEEMALLGHKAKGRYAIFKNRRTPLRFFDDETVAYRGVEYPCMWPIEEYLRWQYLNWEKPYYGDPSKRDKYVNKKKVIVK